MEGLLLILPLTHLSKHTNADTSLCGTNWDCVNYFIYLFFFNVSLEAAAGTSLTQTLAFSQTVAMIWSLDFRQKSS